jgi:hypothetical protein
MGIATVEKIMGQRSFTPDDYEKYSDMGDGMRNARLRDDYAPLSDIVMSEEADFRTKLDNGEELFQYLRSLGE